MIGGLPFGPLVRTEIHPVGTVQSTLKTLEKAQQRLAELVPPAAAYR